MWKFGNVRRRRDFQIRVLAAVRRIPPGKVATYGDVAAAAGVPRAARAVGNIMKGCRAPGVPCHRVVAAGRRPGGYGGRGGPQRAPPRARGGKREGCVSQGHRGGGAGGGGPRPRRAPPPARPQKTRAGAEGGGKGGSQGGKGPAEAERAREGPARRELGRRPYRAETPAQYD